MDVAFLETCIRYDHQKRTSSSWRVPCLRFDQQLNSESTPWKRWLFLVSIGGMITQYLIPITHSNAMTAEYSRKVLHWPVAKNAYLTNIGGVCHRLRLSRAIPLHQISLEVVKNRTPQKLADFSVTKCTDRKYPASKFVHGSHGQTVICHRRVCLMRKLQTTPTLTLQSAVGRHLVTDAPRVHTEAVLLEFRELPLND